MVHTINRFSRHDISWSSVAPLKLGCEDHGAHTLFTRAQEIHRAPPSSRVSLTLGGNMPHSSSTSKTRFIYLPRGDLIMCSLYVGQSTVERSLHAMPFLLRINAFEVHARRLFRTLRPNLKSHGLPAFLLRRCLPAECEVTVPKSILWVSQLKLWP